MQDSHETFEARIPRDPNAPVTEDETPAEEPLADELLEDVGDFAQRRELFANQIENDKIRTQVRMLGNFDYNYRSLFPKVQGWGALGEVKHRVKLLVGLEQRFEHLLYPEERIDLVCQGMLNSWVEQYFVGILMSQALNQTVFLFTNYRVLMINANSAGKPRHMQWQMPYEEMSHFKATSFLGLSSTMQFRLSNNKTYTFVLKRAGDRKVVRQYMEQKLAQVRRDKFSFPHHEPRDPLCPACSTPVPPGAAACEACEAPFMSPVTPTVLSAVFPCLGEFFLGHWFFGFLELVGYTGFWLFWVFFLSQHGAVEIPALLVSLFIVHGMDAVLTWYVANKGVMLKSAAWTGGH